MPWASFRLRTGSRLWSKFWLALRLGMTVGELEERMTNREMEYWLIFIRDLAREPIPQ